MYRTVYSENGDAWYFQICQSFLYELYFHIFYCSFPNYEIFFISWKKLYEINYLTIKAFSRYFWFFFHFSWNFSKLIFLIWATCRKVWWRRLVLLILMIHFLIQILPINQSMLHGSPMGDPFKNGKPMGTHLVYCKFLFSN